MTPVLWVSQDPSTTALPVMQPIRHWLSPFPLQQVLMAVGKAGFQALKQWLSLSGVEDGGVLGLEEHPG